MKLVLMPTGERPFEEIAMHFVGELAQSEGLHAILVVIDRFMKGQHTLAAKTTCTAADIANACINEICSLHGHPRYITSDRGPQFASKFNKELNRKLNNNPCLSTAYHTQTDGLNKRAGQTCKHYLRM